MFIFLFCFTAALHSTVLHCTELHCTAHYKTQRTALNWTVLVDCTAPPCTLHVNYPKFEIATKLCKTFFFFDKISSFSFFWEVIYAIGIALIYYLHGYFIQRVCRWYCQSPDFKSPTGPTKNLERHYNRVVVCLVGCLVSRNAGYNRLIPF